MQDPQPGFLRFYELANSQEDLALSMEYDSTSHQLSLEACTPLPNDTKPIDIAVAYFSLYNSDSTSLSFFFAHHSNIPLDSASAQLRLCAPAYTILDTRMLLAIFVGKKYKPVSLKVCPIETELPSQFCIVCNIKGDLLKDIPSLSTHPPPYQPTGHYMKSAKTLSTKCTQMTSSYPPNMHSCTVS